MIRITLITTATLLALIGCEPYSSAPREHVTCFAGDAVVGGALGIDALFEDI